MSTTLTSPGNTLSKQIAFGERKSGRQSFFLPEFDILRFLAFLAVFMVHTMVYTRADLVKHHIPVWAAETLMSVVRGASYSVDVFFIISSYLITELLLREKQQTGTLHISSFYLRRILRTWPLFYLFLPIAFLVPYFNPAHAFSLRYVLPFIFMVGNWSFVAYGWPATIAVPLWTISVEEQFYLLWPPIVAKLSRKNIVVAAVFMILVANLVRVGEYFRHSSSQHLWANTFAHLDSVAAGILMAIILRGALPRLSMRARIAIFGVCAVILAIRGHYITLTPTNYLTWRETVYGYPIVTLATTAIVVAFLGLPVRSKTLEYLGKISYGLYMFHLMCVRIVNGFMPPGQGPLYLLLKDIVTLAVTIALASFTYSFFEKPFLRLKRKFTFVQSRSVVTHGG